MTVLALILTAFSMASVVAWLWLIFARGMFWRMDNILAESNSETDIGNPWPSITILVPARNEESILQETLPTFLSQEYSGEIMGVLVDDESDDNTGESARRINSSNSGPYQFSIVGGRSLKAGWTGKLWALQTAIEAAKYFKPEFYLFTDADISYPPDIVARLVRQAHTTGSDLVSVMARLRLESLSDRILLTAFIFFFSKLYPFNWSNNASYRTSAAAGGCVLIRRSALKRIGGLTKISSKIIDDCSLAAAVKGSGGKTWLGFSEDVHSIRLYGGLSSIWDMVARTAYVQLGYSPLALLGIICGMALLYLAPAFVLIGALTLTARSISPEIVITMATAGLCAWVLITIAFRPTLKMYGVTTLLAPTLPLAGIIYTLFTVASAWRHWRGKSGLWRGRVLSRS